jgi:hypothetical protein
MLARFKTYLRLMTLALGVLAANASAVRAEPLISEFMASNRATLADEDGAYSDWIEIYNPDEIAADVSGWYLTDSAQNKTKWQLPATTTIPAHGFLVIFASNKDRREPGRELHTNFALSASGEYLGLIKSDGMTVVSDYAPTFPAQSDDISYGVTMRSDGTPGTIGFLSAPTPGRTNSVTGGVMLSETVTFSRRAGPFSNAFNLELSGASLGQKIRYVISSASTPGAALADPTETSRDYTGPIAIDSSVVIRAAIFSDSGAAQGAVSSAAYSKIGADVSTFSSQLPVVVIDTLGSGPLVKDTGDHAGWMTIYGPRENGALTFRGSPELVTPLTSSVRGSSSADFPKKGYNLKLTDEQGNKRAQALLDMPAAERWALIGPWAFDHNYINNALIYSLSNRMGRWAPRTRFVEVFLNSGGDAVDNADYVGIYLLTERIEPGEDRVDLAKLSASDVSGSQVTGGYILKIDTKDEDEFGWTTQHGIPQASDSSVVLVSPKADEMVPAQRDYIVDYVQRMENALFADRDAGFTRRTYTDYIDRASWVDHHILNAFSANPDALIRSSYFTKDRDGKLQAGPVWDFDRALGSYWDERSWRYDVWSGVGGADVWRVGWWAALAQDPEFMQDWVDRWQQIRQNELTDASLTTLADSLAAQIGADAAARDAARWPDNVGPFGSYAAQIAHFKGWLTARAHWIDEQFVSPPTVSESSGQLTFTPPAGTQLAYTLDGSDPRSLGGDIAPNAQLSPTALTVPATANVHVRSYRESMKGVFPGSPWSSAVGGSSSSPLFPRARLVNISSRAMVGSDENALIAGVVVADTEAKRYLARGIGPGLAAFGTSGVVTDPQLSIYASGGVELFRNSGWETGVDATNIPSYSKSVGAFPLAAGSHDSALANQIAAGAYTVQITTPSGSSGVGLAELYELDANGRTVNLSTRANVRTGDGVLIGGFVVQGPAYKRMLIRAVGPTLGAFGVTNALRDPVLTVYSGQQVFATNDRWQDNSNADAVAKATTVTGAFNLVSGGEDAALLITLPPGAYTVEVKGKNSLEGVALLEIYDVP